MNIIIDFIVLNTKINNISSIILILLAFFSNIIIQQH